MSKKVCLLFLIGTFMAFAATQTWAETVYELVDFDSEGAELFESDDVDFFAGGNFYGRYRLPELSIVSYDSEATDDKNKIDTGFTVKWSIKSDELTGLVIQSEETDDEGKYLVVSGVLPASEENTTYELAFVAEITEIDGEDYQSLVGKTAPVDAETIEPEAFDSEGAYRAGKLSDYELDADTLSSVNLSYYVTVKAFEGKNGYDNYIASADCGDYIAKKLKKCII